MRKEMRKISICKVVAAILAVAILAVILSVWLISTCSSSSDDSQQTTTTLVAIQETTTSTAPPASSTTQLQVTTSTVLTTTAVPATSTATTLTDTATTLPEPTTTAPAQPLPPTEVQVQVFNGSGLAGVAGLLTAKLEDEDYIGLRPANASERYSSTVVYYVSPEYLANARQIAEILGLPDDAVQLLPDPSPFSSSEAHVIVVIGGDQIADSLQDELDELAAESASAASTTTSTTTSAPRDLFPTATTMVSRSIYETTVSVAPDDVPDVGPPPVPEINFGDEEATETPNIRVVVQDGPDEGGQLRYLVTRGSELKIEVLSRIGAGTVRVAGYNQSGETSLFSGAWFSFTANRSGVHNVTFTPDSTGVAELIFQIQVS